MKLRNKLTHLVLLLLSLSFSIGPVEGFAHSQPSQSQVLATIQFKSKSNYRSGVSLINRLGMDIAGVDLKKGLVDVITTPEGIRYLESLHLVVFPQFNALNSLRVDSEYKTPDEIASILKNYNQAYPDLTLLKVIGTSNQGRPIYTIKISDNARVDEPAEPALLFNGMHHAREVMSPEVPLDIIEQLLINYGKDETITRWVNANQIWVVPMLNVDGNAKVWSGNNMWRKNVKGSGGIDINRNYPYMWGACNGSSGLPFSDTYRGPSAGSEPETQALMGLVNEIRPVFDISYHSYSELVLYPQGCDGSYSKNKDVLDPIGQSLGKKLGYVAGTSWEVLYAVDGSDIDWMDAEYGVIPFVIELNSRSEGFQPSYQKWRQVTVERNRAGWRHLFEVNERFGVRGNVWSKGKTFAKNTYIRVSKVTSNGKKFFQNARIHPNGAFHIVLPPGTFQLDFVDKTSRNVTVSKEITSSGQGRLTLVL